MDLGSRGIFFLDEKIILAQDFRSKHKKQENDDLILQSYLQQQGSRLCVQRTNAAAVDVDVSSKKSL